MNFTSSDGLVAFVFQKNTPAIPGGSARVGDVAQIWSTVTNRSSQDVLIFPSVVDAADVNPMHPGRDSRIFQGGRTIKAGGNEDVIWGFDILPDAETSVPYLRLLAYYGDDYKHGLPPKWYKDIELRWTINR